MSRDVVPVGVDVEPVVLNPVLLSHPLPVPHLLPSPHGFTALQPPAVSAVLVLPVSLAEEAAMLRLTSQPLEPP